MPLVIKINPGQRLNLDNCELWITDPDNKFEPINVTNQLGVVCIRTHAHAGDVQRTEIELVGVNYEIKPGAAGGTPPTEGSKRPSIIPFPPNDKETRH